ncbi:hypothetical protein [Akkermansia glycaniphila]|uniref:Uncharacterized protein n=1 Tax=Akkermansia glycaniphila TaxID=1679444 RepID=A0A1H6MGK5_9BACT|nr:hypothetical protein [Akkermansia glycaniphila]SEH97444.1 Hypothetical protein PYTT_2215 [Akkermansia glycaniphila]
MTSWLKIEVTLPDKEEVLKMARMLKMKDTDTVVGKLIRLWAWADLQTVDGGRMGTSEAHIDRTVCCKGFAHALRAVGWLTGVDDELCFPNFARHNGETAKARAESARRMAKSRILAQHVQSLQGDGSVTEKGDEQVQRKSNECDGVVAKKVQRFSGDGDAGVADFSQRKAQTEEEYIGNKVRGREIPRCMEEAPPEDVLSPPPPVSLKLVTGENGELEPEFVAFVGWAKSLRPGWDAGRLSRRERTAAVRAFLELERPLSELERTAVPAYLEHEPPDGSKFDYPRDRELLFSRLGEVVQKAVAWFRRTGRRCPSEVERTREEAARRRAENARLAAQREAMSPEVLIEQINGLRVAIGSPLLTEVEMEKIRKGERLHGDA